MIKRFYWLMMATLCLVASITACEYFQQGQGKEAPSYSAENFNAKLMTGLLDPVSRAFLLAGEDGSVWRSEDGYTWQFADTPVTSRINHIAENSDSGLLIAVGNESSILRSDNGGRSWTPAKIELPEAVERKSIRLNKVIHYAPNNVWLAGGTDSAILRSTDSGNTWRLVSYVSSNDKREILTFHVEAETGAIFFGAQYGTIGRSTDAGVNWDIVEHDMEYPGRYIPHVVGFYQYGDSLIAAADEGRLLVSRDHGQHWKLLKIPTSGYFTDSAYDPINKSIVLTTQNGEIVYSMDRGASWTLNDFKVKNWPSDDIPRFSAICYDAKSKSLLVIGNSGVTVRSRDGGKSWSTNVIKPLFNLSVTTLLHDPARNLFVATGLGGFILASRGLQDDPAKGWDVVRPGIDLYMRAIQHIPGSDTFIVAGQLGGIWRSDNDGRSWNIIEPKYPYPNQPPHFRDVIIDPETGALVAAGPDGAILRSTDTGKSWTSVFQGVISKGEAFTKILIDQENRSLVAYEAMYGSVYISRDGGINWTKEAVIDTGGRNIWYGVTAEKLGLLVVIGQQGIICISGDGGHTWTVVDNDETSDLYGAFADEENGALLVTGQGGILLRSEDGRFWYKVDTATKNALRRIIREPKTGALIAFGESGTILRSVNGGQQWRFATSPINAELREAIIEPGSLNVIISGRDGTLLRTTDAGLNWEKLPTHTRRHLRPVAVNPRTGTIITTGESLIRMQRK